MRWLLRAVALVVAAAAVAACSSDGGGGSATSTPAPVGTGPVIIIKDFGYGAPLTVAPGATVTVRQEDRVQHDVSSATFKTPLLDQGETATFTAPTAPGSYDYICSIHPQMHGQLIVQAGAGPGASSPGASSPGGTGLGSAGPGSSEQHRASSPGSSDTGYGSGGY